MVIAEMDVLFSNKVPRDDGIEQERLFSLRSSSYVLTTMQDPLELYLEARG